MNRLLAATLTSAGFILGCATPLTGNYDMVVFETTNGCSEEFDEVAPPEGLQGVIIDTSEGTMTLAGDPDEVCDLDEDFQFACDFTASDGEVDYGPRQDALVGIDMQMLGGWTAADAFEALMSVDLTCTGEDCSALENAGAADCAIEWKITAERDG